jgi:2-polyprenyl-3-methyl-5-hydroxy-6-metoxy-1,4-benzoquinol methylase
MPEIPTGGVGLPYQSESRLDLNESVAAYQDDFAYALDNRLILNWYPQRILKLTQGRSLLDLGLGHGHSALILSRHFSVYTVIDGATALIQRFLDAHSEEVKSIDLRHAYFENFVPDHPYDHIVMGFILEHVNDPESLLRRYGQFLAPGGSLFVAVPNCEALNKRLGNAAGLIDRMDALGESDRLLGHHRLFTLRSLTELCVAAGYSISNVEGIFLKPITTRQIVDLKLSEPILQAMLQVGIDYPELCVGILMELRRPS